VPPTITDSDLSICVIPDTQYYCEQDNGIFEAMTQWVVDEQDTYNIEVVLHEGDLVQNYDSAPNAEWAVAETAIGTLDSANIPALLATGNHDAVQGDPRDLGEFRARFPASRYSDIQAANATITDHGTYDGNPENAYLVQEVGGESFIYVALEFGPRDAAVEWASGLFADHPDCHGILVTHSYLYQDGTHVEDGDDFAPGSYGLTDYNTGRELWLSLVSANENILATASGHHLGSQEATRLRGYNQTGRRVQQQYFNYQTRSNGGDGILRLLSIDTESLSTQSTAYAVETDKWLSDTAANHFGSFDQWASGQAATTPSAITFGR